MAMKETATGFQKINRDGCTDINRGSTHFSFWNIPRGAASPPAPL